MSSTYLRLKLRANKKLIKINRVQRELRMVVRPACGDSELAELVAQANRIEWLQENVTQLMPHIISRRKMRPDTIRLDLISNAC